MSYSLTIHSTAARDAVELASYIGERSFEGMLRWLDAYEAAQDRLRQNPLGGGLAPEDTVFKRGLRQVLFSTRSGNTYRAVYLVDGSQVTLLRVRGQGQPDLTDDDLSAV